MVFFMTKVYTTQDLITILEQERQACLTGQRLSLSAKPSGNPLIDRFLKTEGVQKFTAYQDFKATIHDYQRQHGVSGVVWREIVLKGKHLRFPEVDSHLIALPSDLEILKTAKPSILKFWHDVTSPMDLYLSVNHGKDYRAIAPPDVSRIALTTEWANLCKWEKSDFLEIILQLGWGNPEEAAYKRGWPTSGSEYIHAVKPGHRPIC